MQPQEDQPIMDQKIFDLGLSTESVSLYLLCCHLEDTGAELSAGNLRALWNGQPDSLIEAIADLERRCILVRTGLDDGGGGRYRLNSRESWIG